MNRRDMLKTAGSAAAISVLGGIPLNLSAKDKVSPRNRKKIMVIGAHPDDPETAAGGTMCLLSDAGHEVVSVYLTRGEAGIKGKSHDEAAAIREAEAKAACEVTGARALFLSQIDGSTEVNRNRYQEMREMLSLVHASPVYGLYGYDAFNAEELPPVNTQVCTDRMGYHLREGKHDILLYDWMQFITFADRFLK